MRMLRYVDNDGKPVTYRHRPALRNMRKAVKKNHKRIRTAVKLLKAGVAIRSARVLHILSQLDGA